MAPARNFINQKINFVKFDDIQLKLFDSALAN